METLLAFENHKKDNVQIRDYKTDPNLTKEVKQFLDGINNGGPALETLPLQDAQNVLVSLQASFKVDLTGIEVSEKIINSEGFRILLHIVRPAGVKERLPVFIFIHGGGWILGDFPTHQRMVRDLVVLSGMACVFVNYARTSEVQFPKAINQNYAATKWVAEHGEVINVDGRRLAVVGNSVGGNMAAVTSIMAKEKKGPKIKLQILMWPTVDSNFETPSYKQYGEQRFLTTSAMKWMYDLYLPDLAKRKDIHAAPLQASIEQLKGMPPTLIQTAENDILRDEAEAFGRKLNEAGVKVTTTRYNGMIHDFGLLNGLATIPETRSAFVQAAAELKRYLL
jgi:acetyl esterase